MNELELTSPEHIRALLHSKGKLKLTMDKQSRYGWIATKLKQTAYFDLGKKEKFTVQEYLRWVTGYSRQQLNRLIGQYKTNKWIGKKYILRPKLTTKYTREDILLLVKTDECHDTLCGATTKKLFERAYKVYEDNAYKRLSQISVAHIYNLRKSKCYLRKRRHFTTTSSIKNDIGIRKKPQPRGTLGYIRIDTVHQGDLDKQKGVYHINAVDEVTQFEVICSVERITENFMIPALEQMIEAFPFVIINFHSDNGSEYINKIVLDLLNKLHIKLTKSRPRHSNDNALAESKNGSVLRKYLGYVHIAQKWAPIINEFHSKHLIPYLNFHHPCNFSKNVVDSKGKQKKSYPYELMMTPYEKFKSLDNAEQYLKSGVDFKTLDKQAMALSDLQSAQQMRQALQKLFATIFA